MFCKLSLIIPAMQMLQIASDQVNTGKKYSRSSKILGLALVAAMVSAADTLTVAVLVNAEGVTPNTGLLVALESARSSESQSLSLSLPSIG